MTDPTPETIALPHVEPLLRQWFCPQCGLGAGSDDEQCCTSCGAMLCAGDVLRELLAQSGYAIERLCPDHGRLCWDARCDARDK